MTFRGASVLSIVVILGGLWSAVAISPTTGEFAPLVQAARAAETATPQTPTENKIRSISFDDLKFEMADKEIPFERKMLTPEIEKLAGNTVRLRGYILPTFKQNGLTDFVLMRDNQECCFGPGAWIYDCVIIHMKPGFTASYTTRPVTVDGDLSIEEMLDADDVVRAVYRIDATQVE